MSILRCSVHCIGECVIICTADLVSPILDAIGAGVSEAANIALS